MKKCKWIPLGKEGVLFSIFECSHINGPVQKQKPVYISTLKIYFVSVYIDFLSFMFWYSGRGVVMLLNIKNIFILDDDDDDLQYALI